MAERAVLGAWELHAIRNKSGVFTCHVTDPDGLSLMEPLDVTAGAAAQRRWTNPSEEIDRVGALVNALRRFAQSSDTTATVTPHDAQERCHG